MTIQTRYYRVTAGVLPVAARALHEQREAARLEIAALLTELGASGFFASDHDGHVYGIQFEAAPDPMLWKSIRSYWWPKRNCTAGRALIARLEALPSFLPMNAALNSVGITHSSPMLLGDGRCWFAKLTGCTDVGIWFVGIPTLVKDGEPFQNFAPPAEWEELKLWEVERDIEAIRAARRLAATEQPAAAGGGLS